MAHLWAKWLRQPCRLRDPHRFRAGGEIRSVPLVGKVATSPLPSRGSPPLQSGGRENQEWPSCGQSGYVTPAVSGIPTASERGGGIGSGPLVGKVATSPLPSRGSPPLQSGGGNQKWPTCGQSGYVSPAISGIPTASEQGGKSEVSHLWAKWLRHPCRLGDPHRFRVGGGKIRSGPVVGKVATSPLPSQGSPPLQSGGENQKWPNSGQSGYITLAVSGIPTASERGGKSEVAHLWAKWLRQPCRLRDPHRFRAGGEIRSVPLVGKVATSPLPSRGSPPLQSGGRENQKWPSCGQSGYVTPAVSGIPTASERGGKSEVAHLWAKWLHHPCRLGDPHRFRAGGEIRSVPLVGKVATSPLPSPGSPPLQSGGGNQKWPTCGQSGYVTPAVSGIPTASEWGEGKSEVAQLWAKWLRHPCRLGDPHRCRAGEKIRSGPIVGKVATSPLPSEGSPPLQSGGGEVAHLWAKWLRHPCRPGHPHRFRAGGEIRSGPLVGKVATSALPSPGSPPLQSGGENQKWPSCGQSGYVTPAVSGIPTASERGGKSEVSHLWAKWLRHPRRLGDPHRFRAGGEIRSGPLVGKVATSALPSRGSPPLQSGGGNQKWPTCGQSGYVSPAVSGIPTASERGGKSEVAQLWAKWLRHPCRLGDPHRFRAGGKIRSVPLVGKVATSPSPSRGSPPLQSGGRENQKWPSCGQSGYVTPAVSGIPTASERAGKSEVAHLWAKWLRHPCRLGDPHRCRAGGQIRSGPLVGKVATSPLPSRESPPLQSGGRENQKWPSCGQSGYITPAVSGIPTASERGGKSEVAHLWAKWLHHPCRLGDPHRFRAGGKIRSGPLVGKMATSPMPSWGSPPLKSGGANQKWPTCGQSGYVTPAVSGIPTASQRAGKSEVAHLWAKWLRHPCRLGDPHRCRAGEKIRSGTLVGKMATSPLPSRGSPPLHGGGGGGGRSGPLVGKVATSPLPFRGSPPLQSGGQNQKWPTCGQSGYASPAVLGIPTAAEHGGNQKWPTCGQIGYVSRAVSGIPTASERGAKSEVAHLWAKWLRHPCRLGDPNRCTVGGRKQKWPTCGQSGYVSPAVSGIPTASERGGKSEVAHLWAKWLRHPCRLRDPHCFRAGGGNQKWATCGQSGYITPAVSGIPTASEQWGESEVSHLWAKWLRHPCRLGDPHRFRVGGGGNHKWPSCGQSGYVTPAVSGIPTASERGGKSEVAHLWAKWLRHPCRLRDPHRFRAGGEIRSGPLVGKMATPALPSPGSPPLQSRGGNQKCPTCGQSGYVTPAVSGIPTASEWGEGKSGVAQLWAKWLRHPCRLGDPHRFEAGGGIGSGPLVGKVATSPLPSRGSPPLQSGGGNQKWPTCGQSGYVSPAISGIPTASEQGGKSEVSHLWAKWLRHPCRLGDPHRFRVGGGKIRSGPVVGKVATSPLPSQGSPPLQSGGENQKWPNSGQSGYITLAVSGIPTASERGGKSEVAHLWAKWLRQPCRLRDPHRFRAGGEIRSVPLVGKVATSPLPSRGSPPLQSGGRENQKWPSCGQSGYVTPAVSGIPTASERGGKSEVAHLWAKWLHHPCRLGDPHRFRAGGEIKSGPLVGKVATSPLPSPGSPPLQSGGGNQKWPTCGQSGYVTPAVSGIPTASERGGKSEVAHLWAKWLRQPCRLRDPHRFSAGGEIRSVPLVGKVATSPLPSRGSRQLQSGGRENQKWPSCGQSGYVTPAVSGIPAASERGGKSEVAHLWAKWLHHPCRLGDPHRFRAGGEIRSGPLVGKVATSALPSPGSPPLQSRGGNQKCPSCGQSGYVTPAVSGIPTASEWGEGKSEVAQLWAKWLRHPCRLGDPHRCRAGEKIRSGPIVGKVATSPLPSEGSPPVQSGGGEVAHLWAKWLRHPCRPGDPHRFRAGGEIRSGPLVGKVATSALPSPGSPPLQSGGGNQKWPSCGQSGYVTPAVSGIPTASERGGKSEVSHLWAKWLRHPRRLGDPHRFRVGGGKIRSGPVVGKVATSPLSSQRSPPLQSGGENQKWPNCGQSGYVPPAVSGIPTASERGGKSEVAHLWAKWLRQPCRLRDPHRFSAGGEIRSVPLVGKVATSPLPSRGSPPLQSGGENRKWPTCGQSGYITPAVSGIPTASERGGKSEVAHLWAKWLRHPCHLRDPHRFRAGGEIRSVPVVGKVATSPLPSRGSPPLQSGGGGNQKWPSCGQSGYVTPAVSGIPTAAERGRKSEVAQLWAKWLRHPCRLRDPHRFRVGGEKWPTCGQSGYVTPAVLGIPTASERGGKSEVAHLWAKWLRQPCRLPDPHRFRAGGKIRSGPVVGKVATSPLPSRGSPPLQGGGENREWPTCGQSGYVTPAV